MIADSDNLGSVGNIATVARPRLQSKLATAAAYPVVLISAPAGYGKTTAIRQFLATRDNVIFISLPATASALSRFVHTFAHECALRFPEMGNVPGDNVDDRSTKLELYAAWAIANLANTVNTIVLDDLHHADDDAEISQFLRMVVPACSNSTWILSSRTTKALQPVYWQAYGYAGASITASDLQLTHGDVRQLADKLQTALDDSEINKLVSESHGFPVAVAYAIRTLAFNPNTSASTMMRTLTFEFLAEQLWLKLAEEDRWLLSVAALAPDLDLRLYDGSGVEDAPSRIHRLCHQIAFISISTERKFQLHDLFRDFIKQQLQLALPKTHRNIAAKAADLLVKGGRYADAIEILVDVNDDSELLKQIDCIAAPLHSLEIADNVAARIRSLRKCDMPASALAFLCNYYADRHSNDAEQYAEELLARHDSTSSQRLSALKAIAFFTQFLSIGRRQQFVDRFKSIISQFNSTDRLEAFGLLQVFLASDKAHHAEARDLLQTVSRGANDANGRLRTHLYHTSAVTSLALGDFPAAIHFSRAALTNAESCDDFTGIVGCNNSLGISLYSAYDDEFLNVSEAGRQLVSKTGLWTLSQTSHWLVGEYFARCGDLERATSARSLHEDVIVGNDTLRQRFAHCKRILDLLCWILEERYDKVIADYVRRGIPDAVDGPYQVEVAAAIANGFIGDTDKAERHLSAAQTYRETAPNPYYLRGAFDDHSGEVIAYCLLRQWSRARRLAHHMAATSPSVHLTKALRALSAGPPFIGFAEAAERCIGRPYLGLAAILMKRVIATQQPEKLEALTAAESSVLELLAKGRTNKEIAAERERSVETVKLQLASIFRKLGVDNRVSAVAAARQRGLLP